MRSVRGFTLIELMVTVVVAAILLAIAIPNFAVMLRKNRASTDISALTTTVAYARSEAIARNRNVCIISKDGSDAWKNGWEVRIEGSAGCDGTLLRDFPAAQASATLTVTRLGTATDSFAFTAGGYRDGDPLVISYFAESACDPETGRVMTVYATGRLNIAACVGS